MCIRAPRPEDYPALARIHNDQNEPDFHATLDRLRDADDRRAAAGPHDRRLVLEEAGEPVATLTWHPDLGDDAREDVRWTYPYVRPDRRGEGLDARLVRHALALDAREEIVGVASLVGPARGGTVECGFLGVARAWRNRGVDTALAARTAHIAQGLGFVDLNAAGGGVGTPILAVVRKLGFAVEPARITYASRR